MDGGCLICPESLIRASHIHSALIIDRDLRPVVPSTGLNTSWRSDEAEDSAALEQRIDELAIALYDRGEWLLFGEFGAFIMCSTQLTHHACSPRLFRHKECEISDLKRQLAARDAEIARLRGVAGEEGEGESDRESDHGDGEEEEGLGPEAVAFSVNT